MILLWLNVVIISALVMTMLMFPLLRSGDKDEPDRNAYDLTVYRDQLAEIDRDLARGLLTEDQAAAARVEVQRRMLAVAEAAKAAGVAGGGTVADGPSRRDPSKVRLLDLIPRAIEQGPWGIATLAGVIGVVPMGALALYLVIGSPWLPGQPHAQRVAQVEQEQLANLPESVRAEIETRREAAEQAPDNAEAWLALGRAYRDGEQHSQAVEALERARELGLPEDETAAALAELGESMVIATQGRITEAARARFLNALRTDAGEPRARFYLGMAEAQAGAADRALAIWTDLAADSPADAGYMAMVSQGMAMVAQQSGIPLDTVRPVHPLDLEAGAPVERVDPPTTTLGGGAPTSAPEGAFSAEDQAMIRDMVDGLAARLEENPDDVDGWLRLADSRGVLGEWDAAVAAAERAVEQAPEDPAVLIHAADILLGATNAAGKTEPPERVYEIYEAVLQQDPNNAKALYFVGLSAAQHGDAGRARTLWQRLLTQVPEDQPAHAAIQQQLDALPTE